jgi:hypothetical protein
MLLLPLFLLLRLLLDAVFDRRVTKKMPFHLKIAVTRQIILLIFNGKKLFLRKSKNNRCFLLLCQFYAVPLQAVTLRIFNGKSNDTSKRACNHTGQAVERRQQKPVP